MQAQQRRRANFSWVLDDRLAISLETAVGRNRREQRQQSWRDLSRKAAILPAWDQLIPQPKARARLGFAAGNNSQSPAQLHQEKKRPGQCHAKLEMLTASCPPLGEIAVEVQ